MTMNERTGRVLVADSPDLVITKRLLDHVKGAINRQEGWRLHDHSG